jgi:hypothetical protein
MTIGSDRDLYLSNGVVTFWDGATERAFGTALSRPTRGITLPSSTTEPP